MTQPSADLARGARAVRRLADEDPAIEARPPPVLAEHLLPERLDGTARHQIDGAAPEAAARDARPEHALALAREVYQEVDLRAAHLVVVSQRGVRGIHQLAEAPEVPRTQRRLRFEHARVLGDDVAATPEHHRIELCPAGLERLERRVAQGPDPRLMRAQHLDARRALPAPEVVLRRDQSVPRAAAADRDHVIAESERHLLER